MIGEKGYWVWLTSIPGIGPVKVKQLIEYFKDPENIWNLSKIDLMQAPFMTDAIIRLLLNKTYRDNVKKHLDAIYKNGIKICTITEKTYPDLLKNIYDPPYVIYAKGDVKNYDKSIAIVGSRRATSYGLTMAKELAAELAKNGVSVISGMARGVDTYAHYGSIKAGGKTIAVLGCGLDTVYPRENKKLMELITENGFVASEFLPGVKPMAQNFPARNRIISGMSLGVVVIEAGEKSGSLITADFAAEQGRDVYAVPGNINMTNSRGTNKLIKDGAKMVTSVDDILEELNIINQFYKKTDTNLHDKRDSLLKDLNREERNVAEKLLDDPVHIDELSKLCGLSVQAVSSILLLLELNGVVEQMPGKIFKIRD